MSTTLKAPFPWFGGKSKAANIVWDAFHECKRYVEPFAGSLAVLLARPDNKVYKEIVNDIDGFIVNAWRAIRDKPDEVARYADQPDFQCDLTARHLWLVQRKGTLAAKLEANENYSDPKIAGYWLWGLANWIGPNFCKKGPWSVDENGEMVKGKKDQGIGRGSLHIGNDGRGINRKSLKGLDQYMQALSIRLANVLVLCGDWRNAVSDSVFNKASLPVGIFLDPPYEGFEDTYSSNEKNIALQVQEWAIKNGERDDLRIILAGYREHDILAENGWTPKAWKAGRGMAGKSNQNRKEETLWLSPTCSKIQGSLF